MNTKILITGGTGMLGRALSAIFLQHNIPFEVASRSNPDNLSSWLHIDLETGEGLEEATKGKEIIYHLASGTMQFNKAIDVEGTQRLLEKAKQNGVSKFIYISIVGTDQVPIPYYRYKRQAEEAIENAGIPFTILRATQFHQFIDMIFQKLLRFPIAILPKKAQFQPVETKAVAQKLFELREGAPLNKIINLGGQEVFTMGELAKSWLKAQNKKKLLLHLPLFGKLNKALKGGVLTCTEIAPDSITWAAWLRTRYELEAFGSSS